MGSETGARRAFVGPSKQTCKSLARVRSVESRDEERTQTPPGPRSPQSPARPRPLETIPHAVQTLIFLDQRHCLTARQISRLLVRGEAEAIVDPPARGWATAARLPQCWQS